jgi:hypothetical protein
MIEEFKGYKFETYGTDVDTDNEAYGYVIYLGDDPLTSDHVDTDFDFDTRQEARFEAIGHINLLENGEC